MFAPLEIADSKDENALSAFREVMQYDNLVTSFNRIGQCEVAGTILDA